MPRRGGNQLITVALILIPVYEALSEKQPFDRADYGGGWPNCPPPEEPRPR
jgi:hypothetical protein